MTVLASANINLLAWIRLQLLELIPTLDQVESPGDQLMTAAVMDADMM
jgi:hypothetical protein